MVKKRTLRLHKKKLKGIEEDVKYINDKKFQEKENSKLSKRYARVHSYHIVYS